MTVESALFKIPSPGDADVPNAPAQFKAQADLLDTLLGRAGAQAKKTEVAGEQSRENTAYGLMTTPDEVSGLVIAKGDLLFVQFEALQKKDGTNERAAIFLDAGGGAVQLKVQHADGAAAVQNSGPMVGEPGLFVPLLSGPMGLMVGETSSLGGLDLPTTGLATANFGYMHGEVGGTNTDVVNVEAGGGMANSQMASGVCVIRNLAAGTYAVSVRAKASAGKFTMKNRVLRAWTKSFA